MGGQERGLFEKIIHQFHQGKTSCIPPPISEAPHPPVGEPSEFLIVGSDSDTISKITTYLSLDLESILNNGSDKTTITRQLSLHPFLQGINEGEIKQTIQEDSSDSFATAKALAKLIPDPDSRQVRRALKFRDYEERKKKEENEDRIQNNKRKYLPIPPEERPAKTEISVKPIHRGVIWFPTKQAISQEELLTLVKKTGIPDPEKTLETISGMMKMDTVELLQHYSLRNVQHEKRNKKARDMEGMHQFRIGSKGRLYWRIENNKEGQFLVLVIGNKDYFRLTDSRDGQRSL